MKNTKHYLAKYLLIGVAMVSIALQAQLPGGKTKASDFSDADIKQMVSKAQSAGLSEGQVIQLAKTRGLSDSEIEAFEARVKAVMGGDAPAVKNSAADIAPADDSKVENAIVEKQVQKPATPSAPKPTNNTYGANWFDKNRFPMYSNASSVKAPDNYEIGPGDEIGITLYGNSYFNKVCLVDEGGRIDLGTTFGKVFVKGVTFQKLYKLLRAALGSRIGLNGNNLDISLAYSRMIHINLTGEITTPGTYQMPAVNTVFNALVAAGGPSKTGSFRNIQIVRGGKVVETFDAYEFINNPKTASYLQDGDFVMVQPKGKTINLSGAVLRPAVYELKGDENLSDLIQWAGGLTANALKDKINVTTYNGLDRTLYTLNTGQQQTWTLQNGDEVAIGSQNKETLNQVQVSGPVYFPGTYEWNDSMTIGKLLQYAGGTQMEADLEKAFIIRNYPDASVSYIPVSLIDADTKGRFMVPKDQLVVFTKEYYLDNYTVSVDGAVRNPKTLPFKEGVTLKNMISYCGGFASNAERSQGFVIRKHNNGKIEYIQISLDDSTLMDFELQGKDKLVVFTQEYYLDKFLVEIRGEVRNPLKIPYFEGLSLHKLISYAGGLKYSADITEIEVLRSSLFDSTFLPGQQNKTQKIKINISEKNSLFEVENIVLHPTDIVLVRQTSNLQDRIGVSLLGEVKHPGVYILPKGRSNVKDLLSQSGGFNTFAYPQAATLKRANGVQVVFDLQKAKRSSLSKYNYRLQEGDVIEVPLKPDVVILPNTDTLKGSSSIIAPYSGGRAGYYMRNFTIGFDKNHLKRRLYVIHPGGQIKRSRHLGLFVLTPRVRPGSKILFQPPPIKPKTEKEKKEGEPMDWNKFWESLTTKLTGVATLWVLVSRI